MITLPVVKKTDVFGKRVFLRLDLDVPLSQSSTINKRQLTVEDDTRLLSTIPTIEYLLKQNAKIIITGHLGRPQGVDKSFSIEPVAKWFFEKLKILNSKFELKFKIENLKFTKMGEFEGWEIGPNIFLLENLRFFEEEENNDEDFAKKLASLADVYVNDAFAVSHRKNASVVAITKYLPHFAGFQLQKEVEVLSGILENPKRPLVVIIGGAKLETKLPIVSKMHHIADYVLVGGKLAGDVKTLLKVAHEKIKPPAGGRKSALLVADLNNEGTDITPKSVENFLQIVNLAKTVVWNGPMGKIANSKLQIANSETGTKRLAQGIIKSNAYTVVGGGDTVGFLDKICLLDSFACMPKSRCFLSTGGGAMLAFLSCEKLPGLDALKN